MHPSLSPNIKKDKKKKQIQKKNPKNQQLQQQPQQHENYNNNITIMITRGKRGRHRFTYKTFIARSIQLFGWLAVWLFRNYQL